MLTSTNYSRRTKHVYMPRTSASHRHWTDKSKKKKKSASIMIDKALNSIVKLQRFVFIFIHGWSMLASLTHMTDVFKHVYVCTCICLHSYMYVYVCILIHMYVSVSIYVHWRAFICIYKHTYLYVFIHTSPC